ncbi:hypothetical protein ACPDHJ_05980 [Myroides sp. C8-3]|uniref:hypothetical protein n=1 Tax=Myroides sp. C8-3 TaxID=3400533 RepID=UPI003D2F84C5
MRKLIYFIKNLFTRKSVRVLEKAQGVLEEAVFQKRIKRIELKKEINRCVKRHLGSKSSFIPLKKVSTLEVIKLVEGKFGKQMKELGVIIKSDLTLKNTW